jgi:hypothetical protein
MSDLHHFYHVYSNGNWQVPIHDHMKALKEHGLINNLKTFQIGLVGAEHTRKEVIDFLDSENINYTICTEVDDGWEQETQDKILEFAQENDGYVLYAHTKNAVNINPLHIAWRLSMTYHTVVIWEDVVKHLDEGYSAVGSHYLDGSNENVKTVSGFFGGTFWWTHLKYIKDFQPPARISRYDAEAWIGWLKEVVERQGDEFKIYDYVPTHPGDESKMVTSW